MDIKSKSQHKFEEGQDVLAPDGPMACFILELSKRQVTLIHLLPVFASKLATNAGFKFKIVFDFKRNHCKFSSFPDKHIETELLHPNI